MTPHLLCVPMISPWLQLFRVTLIRSLVALLLAATGSVTSLPQGTAVAQATTQPVVILVRDCAGNPMSGVAMKIKIYDPPDLLDHDQCLTDQDGACTVQLLPRTYRVQFVKGWHGRMFIPVEQQEGFGLDITPANEVQFFTLAVAERNGQLVPVWDMSKDAGQPPQPFLPAFGDSDPLADLYLGPLSTDPRVTYQPGQPAAPETTATPQVVVDEVVPGAAPVQPSPIPAPTVVAEGPAADNNPMLTWVVGLLFAGALVVMAILLVMVIANRPKRKAR